MKVSEIPKNAKVYLKLENRTGGVCISAIHLYPDCYLLTRPSDAPFRRLVSLDPNQLDDEHAFASTLLEGLRICERCRHQLEKPVLEGGAS